MKKLYQTTEWKEYSKKRASKELKRKRAKRSTSHGRKQVHLYVKPKKFGDQWKKRKLQSLTAPSNFSIVDNTEEMLDFFSEYYRYVQEDKKVFFNMSQVTAMTEDAILYMLSQFSAARILRGHDYVSGNVPSDPTCAKLLMESGFYDHVAYSGARRPANGEIFKITTKNLVYGEIAKEVVDFTRNHIKSPNISSFRSIYPTLIECMANTRNHAYIDLTAPVSRWWLIAMSNAKATSVHFTFLDNGRGIPRTIKKNILEKFSGIWGGTSDSELIASALKGEFRTKTSLKWRGKGLPRILSYVENRQISNLKVISNYGYVSCVGDDLVPTDLNGKFYGTLLSWDFI